MIMAFCAKCGSQLAPGAAACSACGAPTGAPAQPAAAPAPARYVSPVSAAEATGFLSALFDLSFTTFITSKLIKILFVISIILAACGALFLIVSGFNIGVLPGILMLVVGAPLLFF